MFVFLIIPLITLFSFYKFGLKNIKHLQLCLNRMGQVLWKSSYQQPNIVYVQVTQTQTTNA